MDRLFITVLNMSITASCVLLVVLVLRLILQRMKVPKWMVCLLWIAVFFRLLCPVALTSEYSLLQYVPNGKGGAVRYTDGIYYARCICAAATVGGKAN